MAAKNKKFTWSYCRNKLLKQIMIKPNMHWAQTLKKGKPKGDPRGQNNFMIFVVIYYEFSYISAHYQL